MRGSGANTPDILHIMARKLRSDSTASLVQAAQARDTTTDSCPPIIGDDALNDVGRALLNDLYRVDPTRWTAADLMMLLESASLLQAMHKNRKIVADSDTMTTHPNGTVGRHPAHVAQQEMGRQLQTLMRDLNIRSKDGARPADIAQIKAQTSEVVDWSTLRK